MTASEEKNQPLRSPPLEGLESPFMGEELFVGETEPEWEARLGALESESPFLQLNLPDLEQEIIGKDERTLVANTLKTPNRWICAIDVLDDKPQLHSRATGILIGPSYVLTAGHVWSHGGKGLTVSPARNGSNSSNPFGKVEAKLFRFPMPYYITLPVQHGKHAGTQTTIRQDDDYMLIILKQDLAAITHREMEGALGYWGQNPAEAVVRLLEPEALQGKEIVVIGYPGDTCGIDKFSGSASQKLRAIRNCIHTRENEWASRQWWSTGILDVRSLFPNRMYHTADTYEGQSGAPICLTTGQTLNLAGIHINRESEQRNLGLRVTERMLRNLCAWMNKDAGYAIASLKDGALVVQPRSSAGTRARESFDDFEEAENESEDFPASAEREDPAPAGWGEAEENLYDLGPDRQEAEEAADWEEEQAERDDFEPSLEADSAEDAQDLEFADGWASEEMDEDEQAVIIQHDSPAGSKRSPAPPPPTPGQWFPFTASASVIPPYRGIIKGVLKDPTNPKKRKWEVTVANKPRETDYSVYVPTAALNLKQVEIDLLVFFHGDIGPDCAKVFDPDNNQNTKKFKLDEQIDRTGRPVVLVVPFIYWHPGKSEVEGKWTAANLNAFIDEVLDKIQNNWKSRPTIKRLIIAGHSRAYDILTPLALEFYQGALATTKGHLADLAEVWSLDSTYGTKHVRALDAWASACPNARFVAVLYKEGSRLTNWKSYYKDYSLGFGPPPNLKKCEVDEVHCAIPTRYIGNLLLTTKSSPDWCKP